jgi:MFS family permease
VKNKHDYSALIIWAALLVTVARYVGAFLASDLGEVHGWVSEGLTILMGVSGLGMGVLDVLGLAYVFDGWRKVLPKAGDHWSSRFKVLTGFVASLFVAGVCILVPFTVSRISSQSMAAALGGQGSVGVWFWSLAVNLAPYLLIGGVTFSQAGFVTIRREVEQDASISMHYPSIQNGAKIIQTGSMHPCKQCDAEFATIPELASHSRWQHGKEKVNGKAG